MRDIASNERNFLGCLLRSPHEVWQVNDVVGPDAFAVPAHRDIYTAIRDMAERGRQITITALQALLPEEMGEAGPTIAVLMTLRENAIDAGSATDYAPFIAENAANKRIAQLGQWMAREVAGNKRPAEEIAADASLQLNEIMSVAAPIRPKSIGEVAGIVAKQASVAKDSTVAVGISTGLQSLDEICGVFLPGDLISILASQGDGKTVIAAQIGIHAATGRRPALFVSMEMSEEQLAARELAALSGVSVSQIHEGGMDAFEWDQVCEAERRLRAVPFHIIDAEEMTVRQIKAQASAMQRKLGLSLVIIDQLDKIKADGKYRDRFERMAEVTRDLKKMAKALRLPVIVLAQRTRGAQRRDDPTPDILDADVPSLERDSDVILGIWRRSNWLRRNKPDGRSEEELTKWQADLFHCKDQAQAICLKRRRGKAFEQKTFRFSGSRMRFEEIS